MSGEQREVHSAEELSAAVADKKVGQITIAADLSELPMLRISPGQILRAAGEERPCSSRRDRMVFNSRLIINSKIFICTPIKIGALCSTTRAWITLGVSSCAI